MNIFITGISRGLGKELAVHYTESGHKVFGFSRSLPEYPEGVAKKLLDSGNFAHCAGSVNNDADIDAAVDAAVKFLGNIDVLINNAAYKNFKMPDEITAEEYKEAVNTNLTAPILICRKIIPLMLKNGGGKIINLSSNAGMVSYAGGTAYCPPKAGLINYSQSLAKFLKDKNISVNVISPPTFSTDDYRRTSPDINHGRLLQSEKVIKIIDHIIFSGKFITGKNYPVFRLKTWLKYYYYRQFELLEYLFQFRLK